jgi:hypothetical protein
MAVSIPPQHCGKANGIHEIQKPYLIGTLVNVYMPGVIAFFRRDHTGAAFAAAELRRTRRPMLERVRETVGPVEPVVEFLPQSDCDYK